ncbi:MAG: hypothetical protein ACI97K_001915 [Glaciecola sp.]|jgi:hypothetical protein
MGTLSMCTRARFLVGLLYSLDSLVLIRAMRFPMTEVINLNFECNSLNFKRLLNLRTTSYPENILLMKPVNVIVVK